MKKTEALVLFLKRKGMPVGNDPVIVGAVDLQIS